MIVVYHINNRISKVVSNDNSLLSFDYKGLISEGLYKLAVWFPQSKIVWCNEELQDYLNLKEIEAIFHHNKMMLSYCPEEMDFLGRKIGYVEESPFIKINKKVSYPTWQMSSIVGVVHASLLLQIKDKIKMDANFDYYLNSVAKVCMPLGLFCYSEPKLLSAYGGVVVYKETTIYTLFKFVKQHYKKRWQVLLFLNLILFENQFPLLPFVFSLFYKTRKNNNLNLNSIHVQSNLKNTIDKTIDVIIPTIGRKKYLYDVLCDLRNQNHLPKNVIIIEQNPSPNSESELDYLTTEKWPFIIKHTFTHQAGACNARNIALGKVLSGWVFLADDDIRIEVDFIKQAIENIDIFGGKAAIFNCLLKEKKNYFTTISQTTIFGSGCSIIKKIDSKKISFNKCLEFGYGEDTDFGLQLRNYGVDVIYFPKPSILHLKAPIGGFRTKIVLPWEKERIQPKPSPTIMYVKQKYDCKEQIRGYKTVLFIKLLINNGLLNLFQFLFSFQKKWKVSLYWANQLNKND